MQVVLNIPDEMARNLASSGEGLSRTALEALALEGYRTQRLTESEIRRLLGFSTRMEVHGFLKAHDCDMHYTIEDLEQDHETSLLLRAKRRAGSDDPAKIPE
jgi:Uncharacterised protein family (UPF0175)